MGIAQRSKHSLRTASFQTIAVLVTLASVLAACGDDESTLGAPPSLSEFSVRGAGGAMYPEFDPAVRHYAVRCDPSDVLTLSATAARFGDTISINGSPAVLVKARLELANPDPDLDIVAEVIAGKVVGRYTLHCLADDFPEIEIVRNESGVTPDLMLLAPKFRENGDRKSYLVVMDNNGVPRFRRKIDAAVNDFKRHPNGLYTYARSIGRNQFGIRDSVIVVLDESLNPIEEQTTVGLTQTDNHDFLFTPEGNHLFISYNSTVRDMSAFGLAVDEVVGDSVIQEVTPGGQVVFEWNSWDHMNLMGCQASGYPQFPSDYAHLNSIDLTPDGDLIASFRGCAQVLKIDRPSGDVIWRLGGTDTDFMITGDPFNEFCGQHTALELSTDSVLMFDNGIFCLGTRETDFGEFSRVVEYQLDSSTGQAQFVRDHSLNGTYQELAGSQGSVQPLMNGNWLISWGNGPDMSVTEVTESGDEIFAMKIRFDDAIAISYRAYRDPNVSLD